MAARRHLMTQLVKSFWADESGQGLVEYALILALVAIGLFLVLVFLRDEIGNIFVNIGNKLKEAPTNSFTTPS
jgi:pilus assembly protein Flp/PilA